MSFQRRRGRAFSAIRAFKDGFRAIASTEAVDARRQRRAHRDRGADLLVEQQHQGRGQQRRPARRSLGTAKDATTSETAERYVEFPARSSIWTGSNDDGTEKTLDGHFARAGRRWS